MDASAANLSYQKGIFEKDMKCSPEFATKLKQEISYTLNDERQNYYIDEAKRSDYIIAASEFSKKSYISVGVPEENVFVCPYGMNSLNYEERHISKSDELVFTFMGGTRQAKGLSYVLEAFTRLSNKNTRLIKFENIELNELKDLFQYLWGEIYSYRLNAGLKKGLYQSFNASKSLATKRIRN